VSFTHSGKTAHQHTDLERQFSCYNAKLRTCRHLFRWPPNSPDIKPIDYKIAAVGMMQERVYKKKIRDIDELRECNVNEWKQLDQSVIDSAIREWRCWLRASMCESKRQTLWTETVNKSSLAGLYYSVKKHIWLKFLMHKDMNDCNCMCVCLQCAVA